MDYWVLGSLTKGRGAGVASGRPLFFPMTGVGVPPGGVEIMPGFSAVAVLLGAGGGVGDAVAAGGSDGLAAAASGVLVGAAAAGVCSGPPLPGGTSPAVTGTTGAPPSPAWVGTAGWVAMGSCPPLRPTGVGVDGTLSTGNPPSLVVAVGPANIEPPEGPPWGMTDEPWFGVGIVGVAVNREASTTTGVSTGAGTLTVWEI